MQKIVEQILFHFQSKKIKLLFVLSEFNKGAVLSTLIFCTTSCVISPPIEEYSLAREAIKSAEIVNSNKYAPGYFYKATSAYSRGEAVYKEKLYEEAKREFSLARIFAEKAENISRLAKLSGSGGR